MTTEEEITLMKQGQIEADRQTLETLTGLDPVAYDYFIYIYDHVYSDLSMEDFVQVWRSIEKGE